MTTVSIYITGGGKGACRFCGTTSNTGLLAISNVCSDPKYQERAKSVCDKSMFVIISIVE